MEDLSLGDCRQDLLQIDKILRAFKRITRLVEVADKTQAMVTDALAKHGTLLDEHAQLKEQLTRTNVELAAALADIETAKAAKAKVLAEKEVDIQYVNAVIVDKESLIDSLGKEYAEKRAEHNQQFKEYVLSLERDKAVVQQSFADLQEKYEAFKKSVGVN